MSVSYFHAPIQIPNAKSLTLADADNSATLQLKPNDTTTSYTIEFPASLGNNNQVLSITSNAGSKAGLVWSDVTASSLAADDITTGDADVNITTSTGNITLDAPLNSNIALQVNSANALFLTSTSANVAGTLYAAGAVEVEGTTEASSTSTGALIVSGGVGVASNLHVGGKVFVTDATTLSSTLGVTGETTLTDNVTASANLSVSKKFIVGVDTFTDLSSSDSARTNLFNGSNAASVKHLDLNTASTLYSNVDAGVAGETLNLFYDNDSTGSANIDFTTNGLYAGSGLAQYLVFTNSGQSASLIYVGGKWRIINTGATVA